MGNEFIHNLAIRPRPVANADPLQIIPSDNDVACFWITNADNTWYKNAALGRPRNQPLGGFKFNVAHSSNGNGFHVDDMVKPDGTTELSGFSPRLGPYPNPTVSGVSVDAIFEGLISYKNRGYGIWARGGPLVFKNLTLFDNRNQMNSPPGPSIIMDSLFIAETDNVGEAGYRPTIDVGGRSRPDFYSTATKFVIKGYETYDNGGPQILVNVTFRNFMPDSFRQSGALGQLTDAPFKHQTLNRYVGLKFENSNHAFIMPNYFDGNKGACLLDIDGAATELTPGGWIVANDSILSHSACVRREDWKGYACPVSLEGYAQLTVVNIGGHFETTGTLGINPQFNNPSARIPRMITHDLTRRASSQVLGAVSSGTVDHIMHSNVILRNFYAIRWVLNIPTPPVLRFSLPSSANNDWVVVSVQYPRTASLWIYYLKNNVPTSLTSVNSLSEIVKDPTNYYFDFAGENLYLYLRNRAVDNYDLPKDSDKFVKLYNREDRFAGILKPIVNGARGNGVAFATLLPNKRTIDFTVHHDLTLIATKMEIGIGDPSTGSEERFISQFGVKYSPFSMSRFSADLSVGELIHLLKGRLFVKLHTTEYSNGHLKGFVACNQGKNSKGEFMCSLPLPIPSAKPCDPSPADSLNIYSESEDMDTSKTKFVDLLPYSRYPANWIDLGVYKYYEFFVKAVTPGELRLNVYFTEIQNNAAKDLTSVFVDPKYIQHYKIDDTRATRLIIPVTDLPFTNKTSLNAIQRVRWIVNGGVYKEFIIDNVRFVKDTSRDPVNPKTSVSSKRQVSSAYVMRSMMMSVMIVMLVVAIFIEVIA
nr:unnamed protein product [Naegleria fowleri]